MKSQIPLSHVRVDIYLLVSPPDQRYIPILNTCTLYWPDGSHIGRRFVPQDKNGPSWMQWPSCSAVDPLFWKLPALVTQLNFLKFIHPADWLRLAATRTRPHERPSRAALWGTRHWVFLPRSGCQWHSTPNNPSQSEKLKSNVFQNNRNPERNE